MPTKRTASLPKPRGEHIPQCGARTAQDVRAELDRAGITVSAWARANGLNRWTVFEVLHGRNKGRWGEAHRCAVLLGLKEGTVGATPEQITSRKAAA